MHLVPLVKLLGYCVRENPAKLDEKNDSVFDMLNKIVTTGDDADEEVTRLLIPPHNLC